MLTIDTQNILKHMKDTFYRTDSKGCLVFISPSVEKLLGYTVDELNGTEFANLYRDTTQWQQFQQQLEGSNGQISSFQAALRHKDGKEVWVDTSASHYYDNTGKIAGIEGITRNIPREYQKTEEELWKSEEQLRLLVQSSEDIITLHSFDGTFLYYNGSSCYPLQPEDVVGKTPYDIFDYHSAHRMVRQIKKISRTGKSATFESHLDWFGKKTWFSEYVYPVFDKNGKMVKVAKVCRNIDKTKRAQNEQQNLQAATLHDSNEWQLVFDSVSELMIMLDKDHRIVRINQSMCRRLGLEAKQCVGHYCCEIMHDMTHAPDSCLHVQTMADGKKHSHEQYSERLGDWFTFSSVPLRNTKGELTATVIVVKDISDRKNYEIKLQAINENLKAQVAEQVHDIRQHEQLLNSIFRTAPTCIGVTKNRILTYVNPMMEQVIGYSKDELCGQSTRLLYPDEKEFDYVGRKKHQQIQEKRTGSIETRWQCKDGKIINILLNSTPIDLQHPEAGSTYTALDITNRKQLENELQENNERLIALINASPDIICFKDGKGRWLLANEADLQMFQLTGVDYRGKTDADLAPYSAFYHDAFLGCMETDEEAWAKGELSRGEEIIPTPDGEDRVFDIVKVPLFQANGLRKGLVVIGHDITELLKTQQRLRQEIVAHQQTTEIIQEKSKETEDTNVALRVLLKQQNDITEEVQQSVLAQLEKAVFPYINLLYQGPLDDKYKEYLDILSEHLHSVGTSFIKRLSNPDLGLTKKEILVADLVRQGKNTKEIARLLNLQPRSVETYRNKIRKKLQLNNKKITLSQYLSVTFTSEK